MGVSVAAGSAFLGYQTSKSSANAARRAQQQQISRQYDIDKQNALGGLEIAKLNYANSTQYAGAIGESAHSLFEAAHKYEEAAHQAEALAFQNAGLIQAEGAEEFKRTKIGQDFSQGLTLAKLGASGAKVNTGTAKIFFDNQKTEDSQILQFIRKAYNSRAEIEKARGGYEKAIGLANAQQVFASAEGALAQAHSLAQIAKIDLYAAQQQANRYTGPNPYTGSTTRPSNIGDTGGRSGTGGRKVNYFGGNIDASRGR